jgi:hypothetical protein
MTRIFIEEFCAAVALTLFTSTVALWCAFLTGAI